MLSTNPSVPRQEEVRLGKPGEDLLAELTDAAYRVALKHRFEGIFVDVQLELWSALRKVLQKDLYVADGR